MLSCHGVIHGPQPCWYRPGAPVSTVLKLARAADLLAPTYPERSERCASQRDAVICGREAGTAFDERHGRVFSHHSGLCTAMGTRPCAAVREPTRPGPSDVAVFQLTSRVQPVTSFICSEMLVLSSASHVRCSAVRLLPIAMNR